VRLWILMAGLGAVLLAAGALAIHALAGREPAGEAPVVGARSSILEMKPAHPRTGARESAGYVQKRSTTDIRMRPSTSWSRAGRPCWRWSPAPSAKLFLSRPGGNTIYEFDEPEVYCYLLRALERVCGQGFARGPAGRARDVIGVCGIVGQCRSGRAAPAFCRLRVGAEKVWWKGQAVDPYPGLVAAVKRTN